jgi:hypothetical protein
VDDFALTPAERALLTALKCLGIRYLVIGLGAALQGAPVGQNPTCSITVNVRGGPSISWLA